MDLLIRPIFDDDEEFRAFRLVGAVAFGTDLRPEDEQLSREFLELDRTRAAFADGRLVGSSAAVSWEVTVPGFVPVPAAAVTWVAVLPTHRRQGVLTAMMASLLDDAIERGEPLAMLLASESVIYGRFGYGLATMAASYEIEKPNSGFREPVEVPGRLRMVELDEARTLLPRVFEHYQARRVGEVRRNEAWWKSALEDRDDQREGASQLFVAVHETRGQADGYAMWRVREDWTRHHPNHLAEVRELIALDPAVRRGLARFCFDLDLVGRIALSHFPVDDPIRWALADPRRLATTGASDLLWIRVLDVPAALSARSYAGEGLLVFDVHDEFRPKSGGRFALDAGPDGAACEPTTLDADLSLSAADLGATYLGGVTFGTLARAGRVVEHRPGALDEATRLFAVDPLPYCDTDF